jgi:hypothetical protein
MNYGIRNHKQGIIFCRLAFFDIADRLSAGQKEI